MKRNALNRTAWMMLVLIVLLTGTGLGFRLWALQAFPELSWNLTPGKLISYFLLGGVGMMAAALVPRSWPEKFAKVGVLAIYIGSLLALLLSPHREGKEIYVCYLANGYPIAVVLLLYCCRNKRGKGILLSVIGTLGLLLLCDLSGSRSGRVATAAAAAAVWLAAAWQDWFELGRKKTMWLLGISGIILLLAVLYDSFYTCSLYVTLHAGEYAGEKGYLTLLIREIMDGASLWGPAEALSVPDLWQLASRQNTELMTSLLYLWGWGPFFLVVLGTAALLVLMAVHCRKAQPAGRLMGIAITAAMAAEMILCLLWSLGFNVLHADFPLFQGQINLAVRLALQGLMFRLPETKDNPCVSVKIANFTVFV